MLRRPTRFSISNANCVTWCMRRYLSSKFDYDTVVIGGGHAGTEAACASARMGAKTLLVTHKFETIGEMSCNPSFGGIGKGHLMKEVDALDGLCGRICDLSGIQYKVLNRRKGPAVWGPRAQIDRKLYKKHMQEQIIKVPNLTIQPVTVEDLILSDTENPSSDLTKRRCVGVILGDGSKIYGKTVIITAGTFLRGTICIGLSRTPAGRIGDAPSVGLAKTLEDLGFTVGRLKTGTPPRLDGKTIDFCRTTPMGGDEIPMPFSFMNDKVWIDPENQVDCHMTYTNDGVTRVVEENQHLNRHVLEEKVGPRYCPSIESKVVRFKGRSHQIWLEPEGLDSDIIYPNGITCTLPADKQQELVNCIPGLEKSVVVQPGYGVEYDFMDPRQLKPSLETKIIQNLFFAGQINGTTGYEEAAAQGIIAGINAACIVQNKSPFTVNRTEAYIGVLIDDLTTQGTNEPYRMFTSRAEFRLHLRPDNADIRLSAKGYNIGCVSKARFNKFTRTKSQIDSGFEHLKSMNFTVEKWRALMKLNPSTSTLHKTAIDMMVSPHFSMHKLAEIFPELQHYIEDRHLSSRIEIEALYHHYIQTQQEEMELVRREEQLKLPESLDYFTLNISNELKSKLAEIRPVSIAAASRIPGITPASIVTLLRHVKKMEAGHLNS